MRVTGAAPPHVTARIGGFRLDLCVGLARRLAGHRDLDAGGAFEGLRHRAAPFLLNGAVKNELALRSGRGGGKPAHRRGGEEASAKDRRVAIVFLLPSSGSGVLVRFPRHLCDICRLRCRSFPPRQLRVKPQGPAECPQGPRIPPPRRVSPPGWVALGNPVSAAKGVGAASRLGCDDQPGRDIPRVDVGLDIPIRAPVCHMGKPERARGERFTLDPAPKRRVTIPR